MEHKFFDGFEEHYLVPAKGFWPASSLNTSSTTKLDPSKVIGISALVPCTIIPSEELKEALFS